MSCRSSLRYSVLIATAAAISVLWPSCVSAESDLERQLRYQYNDKTLVVRNFYHGERLSYDSAGSLLKGSSSGDWTVDGFVRVKSLDLHGQRLTVHAERVSLGNTGQTFQFEYYFEKNEKKNRKQQEQAEKERRLRVDIEFGADEITAEKADAALAKIFLTAQDRFAELVPDYWKPCVRAASTGQEGKRYKACSFPPEFAAIPGVVYSSDETQKPGDASAAEAKAPESLVGRIGKGITPPKVIFQKNPEFSEPARSAKYQGIVVLSLVVDKAGQVRNVRVLTPLGFGLDQKAVETVSKWQFEPAAKDGKPVEVELAVETNFHLY
jgi:TonB family protein